MNPSHLPRGNETREAIDSLRGYVYQIYQTAVAWTELDATEFLFGMVLLAIIRVLLGVRLFVVFWLTSRKKGIYNS